MSTDNEHEFDEQEFAKNFESAFDSEQEELRKQLNQKLVIGIFGNVGSGKSSLANAIFGDIIAEASPIAGWTKDVKLYQVPWSKNVIVADTPGLQDVNTAISGVSELFANECDMMLFVLNGAVGCTDNEQKAYQSLADTGQPILAVLNKIDAVRGTTHEVADFIKTTRQQLGAENNPFAAVAADPDPRITPSPINIDDVARWMFETARDHGQELLLAKALKDKRRAASHIIYGATAAATAAGALPIPGSDYVTLTGIQASMIVKLSSIYNKVWERDQVVQFVVQVVAGRGGKELFRLGLQMLKAAGWFGGPFGTAAVAALAASIAGATTYGLGWAAVAYLESGMELPLEDIIDEFAKRYHGHRKEDATV